MVTPNFDLEDMANAFNAISEAAASPQVYADMEQYLLSELMVKHKDHVVQLLQSFPGMEFVIDESENVPNTSRLYAQLNGVRIDVILFELEDLFSVQVMRESEDEGETETNPQHEWFYELWETLCFISDEGKLAQLTDAEAAIYYIGLLEAEVMNGGLGQYLTNTDGAYIGKTVKYLDIVGAGKTCQILNEAIAFKGKKDRFIDIWVTKKEQLEALDNKFMSSEEDLAGLVAEIYLEQT